jgi:hypothetical protein
MTNQPDKGVSKTLFGLGADAGNNTRASPTGNGWQNVLSQLSRDASDQSVRNSATESGNGRLGQLHFGTADHKVKENSPPGADFTTTLKNTTDQFLKSELDKMLAANGRSGTSPNKDEPLRSPFNPTNIWSGGVNPIGIPSAAGAPTPALAQAPVRASSSSWARIVSTDTSGAATPTTAAMGNVTLPQLGVSSATPVSMNSGSFANMTATAAAPALDFQQAITALASQSAQQYVGNANQTFPRQMSTTALYSPQNPAFPYAGYQNSLYSDTASDATYATTEATSTMSSAASHGYPSRAPAGLAAIQTNLPYQSYAHLNNDYGYGYQASGALQGPITPITPSYYTGDSHPMTPYGPPSGGMRYSQSNYPNWDAIVDQILIRCDQQCSINMQQKIKNADPVELGHITDAIVKRGLALMTNRTGNFLVQRLLEHGGQAMTNRLANVMLGNVVALSMNMFSCHVVQKALDVVTEEHKRMFVDELLHQISPTIHNKFAAHVWQKLFELRWRGTPPPIMPRVIVELKGQWKDIANGETGSLVVQNIFENTIDEHKRPVINEILENIDAITLGQYGNWCIQHIAEHGAAQDKDYVMNYVLQRAVDWSFDQYASKVIEKALKVGQEPFIQRFLDIICVPEPGRSRVPLVDIAGDQYGNYLIQWILCHTVDDIRERIAVHVRRHMVSLRGSKYGSRVAIACTDWTSQTRPGPATGIQALKDVGFGRHGPGQGPVGGPFRG